MAAVAAFLIVPLLQAPRSTAVVKVLIDDAVEPDWGGNDRLTADPVAGFRPKRGIEIEFEMAALDDSLRLTVEKRRGAAGFLRASDLPAELTGPVVLALGDSHLDGVVSTEQNLTSLLESALRGEAGEDRWVLNAGCGQYSLYQYALRARSLAPVYRPSVLLVTVFCGNDFLGLENLRFPHLDDELVERRPETNPPPESTSERLVALDLVVEAPFWQGMNQALYLHERPERRAPIRAKATRTVELLEEVAAASGSEILWVLIPSFDLVFPDKIASASPLAAEVVEGGAQLELHRWFRQMLQERGARCVDMLPVFVEDGSLGVFAIDFHIFVRGHRLVAEAVLPELRDLLR